MLSQPDTWLLRAYAGAALYPPLTSAGITACEIAGGQVQRLVHPTGTIERKDHPDGAPISKGVPYLHAWSWLDAFLVPAAAGAGTLSVQDLRPDDARAAVEQLRNKEVQALTRHLQNDFAGGTIVMTARWRSEGVHAHLSTADALTPGQAARWRRINDSCAWAWIVGQLAPELRLQVEPDGVLYQLTEAKLW